MDSGVDNRTDEQLLDLMYVGDTAAKQVLFRRYAIYAVNLAARLLRNKTQAEEAAQDSWLALLLHLKKHRITGGFRPYLAATIINKCKRILRDQRKLVSLDEALQMDAQLGESYSVTSEVDVLKKVEQEYWLREMRNCLSESEYEAVRLRHFDDLSYEDVACALGKTAGHARLITHRALNALRTKLKAQHNSGEL